MGSLTFVSNLPNERPDLDAELDYLRTDLLFCVCHFALTKIAVLRSKPVGRLMNCNLLHVHAIPAWLEQNNHTIKILYS